MNVHNLQIDDTHYLRASELEDGSFELAVVKHVRDTSDFLWETRVTIPKLQRNNLSEFLKLNE